jgi:phosphopantothenoylcysteine decarboxylase / phosphopantothenate---cysteine ligase
LKNKRKVLKKVLKNKSVLLGVSGSVASYKAVDLIRRLREEGLSVTVVMTEAAGNFITRLSLEVASQNRVCTDLFSNPMAHITLPANADIFIVAPATANIIGKFANGIADDILSTCFLSFKGKVAIAPAMSWRIYENPFFQDNLKTLLSRGVVQIGPDKGSLACGEEGMGKMADIATIVERIKSMLTKKDLQDEKVLVTAGPTREFIDPVRFISNRSSGKMGYSLAQAAFRRGAEVTLISGHSTLDRPDGVKFISVETSNDMLDAVNKEIESSTVFIMSAAVSDFMPLEMSEEKIEKSGELFLRLKQTPDIVSEVSKKRKRPFIIGFAAETGKHTERARRKLKEKNMDMIVFNDVTEPGSGFDADTNKVIIIDEEKETELPLLPKDSVADAILARMIEIRA